MCLIIFSPNIKHAKIRYSVLARGFDRNDDGAGIAYVKDGQLVISKAYHQYEPFLKEYKRIRSTIHRGPLLIHFRWKTCGPVNDVNTQPLAVHAGRLVMAHNGVFSGLSDAESEISDSVRLARLIRRNDWQFPFSNAQSELLAALCDDRSKLVFIDNQGKYLIINEKLGAWRAGSWYSDKARVFAKWPASAYYVDDDDDDEEDDEPLPEQGYEGDWKRETRYDNDYNYHDAEAHDPDGVLFAQMMMAQLDPALAARCAAIPGVSVKQTGSLLNRPKIPEGVPYAQMTKIQKAAFEAHRAQQANRARVIEDAARKGRSLPSHPFGRHSVVHSERDFGAISRIVNDRGD